MARTTSETRLKLLRALEESGHISADQMMKNLGQVIKGERVSERYDREGNIIAREVSRAPADVARGAMLLDALSGGELGLTPQVVNLPTPTEQIYEQYAPTSFNENVIQNEGAREHLVKSYGQE